VKRPNHESSPGSLSEVVEFFGPEDLYLDPSLNLIAVNVYGDEDSDVNGVTFLTDGQDEGSGSTTANGVTVTTTATGQVNDRQRAPEFTGEDAASAENLSAIMHDIRWAAAPAPLSVEITGLSSTTLYDIQFLFNEGRTRGFRHRFWDIGVNGALVVDNMSSEGEAEDDSWKPDNSFAYRGQFESDEDGEINISMQDQIGGEDPLGGDHNPLLDGVIVHDVPRQTEFQITEIKFVAESSELAVTFNSRPRATYALEISTDLQIWIEVEDSILSEGMETSLDPQDISPFLPEGTSAAYARIRRSQ